MTAMMPTFPSIVSDGRTNFSRAIHELSRRGSIAESISEIRHFEGRAGRIIREDKSEDVVRWKESSATIELERIPLRKLTPQIARAMMDKIAGQFRDDMSKHLIATITEATDKTGNIIDGKGEKLSERLLIEALEMLPPSFDEHGNFQPPTMVIHPDMAPAIEAMANSPDRALYDAKVEEIIERKKNEHRTTEARRRLVG